MKRHSTQLAGMVLAAGLVFGLAGCGFVTPIATNEMYDPSDGVSATVGEMELRNVLAVTSDDETGDLVMTAINNSDEAQNVEFVVDTTEGENRFYLEVAANTVLVLGSNEESKLNDEGTAYGVAIDLGSVGVPAGSVVTMKLSVGSTSKEIVVPMLNTDLPEYAHLEN